MSGQSCEVMKELIPEFLDDRGMMEHMTAPCIEKYVFDMAIVVIWYQIIYGTRCGVAF